MSRLSKILMVLGLILFVLACNLVTQPIQEAQELAGTAQSFASALPVETLQALASAIPAETLQALPSVVPTFEALATDFGPLFNPQGAPVTEWNGIPIMPQATAGQEFDSTNYSFKATATAQEVQDFYNAQLASLGWSQSFSMPGGAEAAFMLFEKDNQTLTVTVTPSEGSVVVLLTLG
ncbi:MAG TPA: hypothetical protein VFZ43_13600 [Anaerolineales bacterium]